VRRALAIVALLIATACSATTENQTADSGPTTTVATRPYEFASWTETFIDRSRPTEAGALTPAAPERTLATTVYLPAGSEPRPLIVFSHGVIGHPDKFSQLLSAWARAGYVVAAPAFPQTNDHVPGSAQNLGLAGSQPADVSFVLDQMLGLAADPDSPLYDRIDPNQIGAGGLSLGGATTYAVAFSPCCRDHRIKAVEVLSGALLPVVGEFDLDGHVPLLIAHGDQDPLLKYANAQVIFEQAAPPVWFVTLIGASHATEFENDVTPYDATAEQVTIDFWDATIGGDPTAFATLAQHATVLGLSTLQTK
jgi:dienelactone hydrolase